MLLPFGRSLAGLGSLASIAISSLGYSHCRSRKIPLGPRVRSFVFQLLGLLHFASTQRPVICAPGEGAAQTKVRLVIRLPFIHEWATVFSPSESDICPSALQLRNVTCTCFVWQSPQSRKKRGESPGPRGTPRLCSVWPPLCTSLCESPPARLRNAASFSLSFLPEILRTQQILVPRESLSIFSFPDAVILLFVSEINSTLFLMLFFFCLLGFPAAADILVLQVLCVGHTLC